MMENQTEDSTRKLDSSGGGGGGEGGGRVGHTIKGIAYDVAGV